MNPDTAAAFAVTVLAGVLIGVCIREARNRRQRRRAGRVRAERQTRPTVPPPHVAAFLDTLPPPPTTEASHLVPGTDAWLNDLYQQPATGEPR